MPNPIPASTSPRPISNTSSISRNPPEQGLPGSLSAVKNEMSQAITTPVVNKEKSLGKKFSGLFSKAGPKNAADASSPAPIPKFQTFKLPGDKNNYHIPGYKPGEDAANKLALRASRNVAGIVASDGSLQPLPVSAGAPITATSAKQPPPNDYRIFCTLYATDKGSSAINTIWRSGSWQAPDLKDVAKSALNEMSKRCGHEHDSLRKTNPYIAMEMASVGGKLTDIAEKIYAGAKPATQASTIYRGIAMSTDDIANLRNFGKKGTPVQAPHFLSCSREQSVANGFSIKYIPEHAQGQTTAKEPVLFKIQAFSQAPLRSLASYDNEKEVILSPLAQFQITSVKKENIDGIMTNVVGLREIPRQENPALLPH